MPSKFRIRWLVFLDVGDRRQLYEFKWIRWPFLPTPFCLSQEFLAINVNIYSKTRGEAAYKKIRAEHLSLYSPRTRWGGEDDSIFPAWKYNDQAQSSMFIFTFEHIYVRDKKSSNHDSKKRREWGIPEKASKAPTFLFWLIVDCYQNTGLTFFAPLANQVFDTLISSVGAYKMLVFT